MRVQGHLYPCCLCPEPGGGGGGRPGTPNRLNSFPVQGHAQDRVGGQGFRTRGSSKWSWSWYGQQVDAIFCYFPAFNHCFFLSEWVDVKCTHCFSEVGFNHDFTQCAHFIKERGFVFALCGRYCISCLSRKLDLSLHE